MAAPSDAHRVVRGAGVRLVAYVLSTILSVLAAAVLLRYLGVADYGRYVAVFALVGIVGGITEAGTANVGVRELAVRPPAEHARVLADLQGIRLALTAAGAVLAVAFTLLAGYDDAMVLGAVLAGAGLLASVSVMTGWIPLQARLQLARVAALELLRQALTVIVLLVLVAAGGGLAVLLGAQLPVAAGLALAGVWLVRASLRPSLDPRRWRGLLAGTIPYASATAIGLVYSSSVIVVMSLAATDAQTGLYGAASRVFVVLAGTSGLLVASAFPLLALAARDDHVRLQTGVQRVFDVLLVAAAGLAVVTAAGAPVAIEVIAGPQYGDAADVLRILAPALVGSFVLSLGAFALLSVGRQADLIAINAAGLAVTVGLALWLVDGHGAEGGAVATLVGESLIAVLSLAALARAGVVPGLGAVPRILVAAALAGAPALVLPALPAAVLATLIFAGAALALGLVPPELRAALQRS